MQVMQSIVNQAAAKISYNTQNLGDFRRGSVVFNNELEGIMTDQNDHYDFMR